MIFSLVLFFIFWLFIIYLLVITPDFILAVDQLKNAYLWNSLFMFIVEPIIYLNVVNPIFIIALFYFTFDNRNIWSY